MTSTNYSVLYEKIGYLYYAIAAADKHVREEEMKKVSSIIDEYWLTFENSTDEYEGDLAYNIMYSFDYLLTEHASPAESFATFQDYFNEHDKSFSKTIRNKIVSSAYALADAFRSLNKNESRYLAELEHLFMQKQ